VTPASASGTSRASPRGAMFPARSLLRRWLPRPVLIELARLRRLPSWLVETPDLSSQSRGPTPATSTPTKMSTWIAGRP